MTDVTRILKAIERGNARFSDDLLPLVYEELRVLATQKMAQEKVGQTLQATALVHETYLRLVGSDTSGWDSRGHFFKAAAEAMRRILVEKARSKKTHKRGGGIATPHGLWTRIVRSSANGNVGFAFEIALLILHRLSYMEIIE